MALVVALIIQAGTLVLLRHALTSTWLTRVFPVMILIATVYHGLNEVVMLVPGALDRSMYRHSVGADDAHAGALVVSGAMFVSSVGYLLALGRRGRAHSPSFDDAPRVLRVLDWRILLLLTIPLGIVTYSGRGYNSGRVMDARTMPLMELLAMELFPIAMVLVTISFIATHGRRFFMIAVAVQAISMAAAGQRLDILVAVAAVAMITTVLKVGPTRKQLLGTTSLGLLLVLAITAVRAEVGRDVFYSDTGIEERVSTIFSSAFSPAGGRSGSERSLLAQATERLDSNAWAGYILRGMENTDPVGVGSVIESMGQVLPSALKTDLSLLALSPERAQIYHFGIPDADYLPGNFGLWLGITGLVWYLPVHFLFGLAFGLLERWILKKITAARLVWFALLAVGALFYERGIPEIAITLRAGLILGPLAFLAQSLLPQRAAAPTPGVAGGGRAARIVRRGSLGSFGRARRQGGRPDVRPTWT